MKKLIGFLFLLLIVKYNLGDLCVRLPMSTTFCKIRDVNNKKALCLGESKSDYCELKECKDADNTILDAEEVMCESYGDSQFAGCVNKIGTECELRLKECSQVSRDSEETCNQHPVDSDKEATHICIYDSSNKKCIEQYLCESVPTSDTEINCETVLNNICVNLSQPQILKLIAKLIQLKKPTKILIHVLKISVEQNLVKNKLKIFQQQFQIWKQLLLYKQQKIKKQYYL